MYKTDWHIHTNSSNDGEFTPEEIVELAEKASLQEIAITDHNSVSAVERAVKHAKNSNVKVVSGIEIDCVYEGINIHLLGYHVDYKSEILHVLEKNIYTQEMNAFEEKIEKMRKLGMIVDKDKILHHSGSLAPSGELIGEIIMENPENRNHPMLQPYYEGGERSDMPLLNFYWDFFSQNKLGYVHINYPSFYEAREMIKKSGGVVVLAHPGNNFKNKMEIFDKLVNEQLLEGMEVFSNYHTLDQVKHFYQIARTRRLLTTCGSDFHGKIKPLIKLGEFGEIEGFEDFFDEDKYNF